MPTTNERLGELTALLAAERAAHEAVADLPAGRRAAQLHALLDSRWAVDELLARWRVEVAAVAS